MNDKSIWLAIVVQSSHLGFPLMVTPDQDLHANRNWVHRRGMTIVGECRTEQEARLRVEQWLHPIYEQDKT
jgi:hypothetical protein